MAYRMTPMGTRVELVPKAAARELVDAFKAAGGNAGQVATGFNVDYRTLTRWMRKLDAVTVDSANKVTFADKIAEIRAKNARAA